MQEPGQGWRGAVAGVGTTIGAAGHSRAIAIAASQIRAIVLAAAAGKLLLLLLLLQQRNHIAECRESW